ncbi:AAA family ATPase [Thalassotalea litorea]|uniref:AAA family ATPase n=1 Tax=Thalassotalea litorea TaxID=2020715 RepID=A0A5R9IVQ7_9GAMM|nr:AAA family ATPase [Thalassotalea litorea]TLU67256.1 AAA family ATPase [Thalassotalea litorea]
MFSGYTGFFGLNEVPFSIAPNPHYLFMSDRHREALAHLSYGLGETGGFALLTGEVGTGKTTVSRCLLEQLPDNAQVAYIINPTLSAIELLASVCDEFGIVYDSQTTSLKGFTDLISSRLLENHSNGMSTLLIIDEAQHLQAEVLEQLRLLTNLETNAKKLLQVILIGQPELQLLLKRQDLRQLAQRITARYHLMPLSAVEVAQYIKHRLKVAGSEQPLFSPSAIRLVHHYSEGVPRLINLICDRALLAAYSQETTQVDNKLVKAAAHETLGEVKTSTFDWAPWKQGAAIVVAVISLAFAGKQLADWQQQNSGQELQLATLEQVSNRDINLARDLQPALASLFHAWHLNLSQVDTQACQYALDLSLSCHWLDADPEQLMAYSYPAVIELQDELGGQFYGVINANAYDNPQVLSDAAGITIHLAGVQRQVSMDWLEQHYRGTALLLWQPPAGFVERIDSDADVELLQWLEERLSQAQQRPARQVNTFDQRLLNQIQQFQRANGMAVLDFADLDTVIMLANPGSFATLSQKPLQAKRKHILADVKQQGVQG